MFPLLELLSQWYNAQLFQQTSISPGIFWCLRRLDATVGCANVRDGVTLWSVCSRTCQVCIPAVNLMLSLAVHATRSISCSPPPRSDQFCLERITLCCGPSGPAFACVNLRLIVDTRSQLRSCHDQRLSVSKPTECTPTSIHRLSQLKVLIIPINMPFTLSTLRTPSRTTTNTPCYTQSTIRYGKVPIYTGSGANKPKFEDVPQIRNSLSGKQRTRRRNPAVGHASGEDFMDSRSRSSRHYLVWETQRTSLRTTSSRRSEIMATGTLLMGRARRRWDVWLLIAGIQIVTE